MAKPYFRPYIFPATSNCQTLDAQISKLRDEKDLVFRGEMVGNKRTVKDLLLNKEKQLISEISSSRILEMIKDGTITGGMIPKINTCLDSVNNGVRGVVIMDGRKPHSILNEIFSDSGDGTLIR